MTKVKDLQDNNIPAPEDDQIVVDPTKLKLETLERLRMVIQEMLSWKETTKTQRVQLAKVYNDLKIKLNQGLLF